jgi:hypothetical protein
MVLFLMGTSGGSPGHHSRPEESHSFGAPSSYVHFIVSHAYSDGFCSVPLIHDFSCLYTGALAEVTGRRTAAGAMLAHLPYGAAAQALEERFFAAIDGLSQWSHPDQLSLRATCFDAPPTTPKQPPWVYVHTVLLESGAVQNLRRCTRRYGIPVDVILLSSLLASMFRASQVRERENPWLESTASEEGLLRKLALTLYAPMRDGDLNDAMIGLFSDWRDCVVPCSERSTLLGFCLEVADTVRNRRWTVYDPVQNSERLLINILPFDEQPRGSQEFHQTRAHEYGNRREEARQGICSRRRADRCEHRPMRITLEQESLDAWWLVMDINADFYPTAWCRCLVGQLKQTVEDLARSPLAPVLGAGARPTHGAGGMRPESASPWAAYSAGAVGATVDFQSDASAAAPTPLP